MNKLIYGLALALVMGATGAMAERGGEGDNTNCNGRGNPNSPCVPDTRTPPDDPTTQTVGALSTSSSADANANADSASNALAAGGDASASSGGNTQGVNIQGGDSSYTYDYNYDVAAASAAHVYAMTCTTGGSAQAKAGGFSIANSDVLCDHLKMASFYQQAHLWELEHAVEVCAEPMSIDMPEKGMPYMDTCFVDTTQADKYLALYHESIADATLLMDKSEEAGLIDKTAGYLVRPLALIGALIWLL